MQSILSQILKLNQQSEMSALAPLVMTDPVARQRYQELLQASLQKPDVKA